MEMSTGQYRALVAYLSFWVGKWDGASLERAKIDIGITDTDVSIILFLRLCGWIYDPKTHAITFEE